MRTTIFESPCGCSKFLGLVNRRVGVVTYLHLGVCSPLVLLGTANRPPPTHAWQRNSPLRDPITSPPSQEMGGAGGLKLAGLTSKSYIKHHQDSKFLHERSNAFCPDTNRTANSQESTYTLLPEYSLLRRNVDPNNPGELQYMADRLKNTTIPAIQRLLEAARAKMPKVCMRGSMQIFKFPSEFPVLRR